MIDTTANTATTGMTTAIAAVRNLRAYYITDAYGVRRTVKAVDDVSIAIRPNEIFGIAGESGCGKSTLLRVMLGMVEPPLTVLEGMVDRCRAQTDPLARGLLHPTGLHARAQPGAQGT
jgi:ABC-type glutathione transport system ATPase component